MLKPLLKKQFLELNTFYFQNKKTGKNRSKGGTIGMILIFVLLFASLGFAFYQMDALLCSAFVPLNLDWLYFSMMGVLAIFLGVFGGVFNTYAGLYHAKDNELLLSMPIPPSKILFARMVGVYAMGLLYEALVIVPAIIAYWVMAPISAANIVFPILLVFITGFLVLALVCALGWVVAVISSKLKNKSFITVIASLVFLGLYYFVYSRINALLQFMASNALEIGNKVKNVYPLYAFGEAWTGKILPFAVLTVIIFAIAALTYFILSKTFIKIVATKNTSKKAEYKVQKVKGSSVQNTLLRKELKRFTSSPTYMMNGGLGLIIAPVLSIFALVKADDIREVVSDLLYELPEMKSFIPIVAALVICTILSMNQITAPSVSLEGKSIWILQSLPVSTQEILNAKQRLHLVLNIPVAVICSVLLSLAFGFDSEIIIVMIAFTSVSVMFTAAFGLFLNLKAPNLTWTNEVVPIKQGVSVMIGLFGSWIIAVIIGGIGYLTMPFVEPVIFLIAATFVMTGVTVLINTWIKKKGTVIFENL